MRLKAQSPSNPTKQSKSDKFSINPVVLLNNYDICLCAAQPRTESARRGRYHQWPILGVLPITAVIVRSSADINACGQTSLSCYIHGLCLLLSAKFFAYYLNYIPLACLSAILLHTGYKLAKPALFHRKLPKRHESTTAFCHHCTCSFSDRFIDRHGNWRNYWSVFFIVKANYHAANTLTQDGSP